jgi:hypothetical protein
MKAGVKKTATVIIADILRRRFPQIGTALIPLVRISRIITMKSH